MQFKLFVMALLVSASTISLGSSLRQNCQTLYKASLHSQDLANIKVATQTCEEAAEELCVQFIDRDSDGPETIDGILVKQVCELTRAQGANKALNGGSLTSNCQKATSTTQYSISVGDLAKATELCANEAKNLCLSKRTAAESAACQLQFAFGGYSEVKAGE